MKSRARSTALILVGFVAVVAIGLIFHGPRGTPAAMKIETAIVHSTIYKR
ncbi:MAG: hypothetical protein M3R30_10320 [Candidatus Eremiobacteraeota bacterium]|nr:hypothetical protein [Candidatus Eremiobacteraeota bacterium]